MVPLRRKNPSRNGLRWSSYVFCIQPLCLPHSLSVVAGNIYGSFERPHCFAETSAGGAGFDQGPTAEESRALTNPTCKPHGCRARCCPRRTNSNPQNPRGRNILGLRFQWRVVLCQSVWNRHHICHHRRLCQCLGCPGFTRSAKCS